MKVEEEEEEEETQSGAVIKSSPDTPRICHKDSRLKILMDRRGSSAQSGGFWGLCGFCGCPEASCKHFQKKIK